MRTKSSQVRTENRNQSGSRWSSIGRIGLATVLIAVGVGALLVYLPVIDGSLLTILRAHLLFATFIGFWYIFRPAFAWASHASHDRWRSSTSATLDQLPSVSVLVPAYNESGLIEDTIASIDAQTYTGDVEIVVVDDGSTDETWSILQRLEAEYDALRAFTKENEGIGPTQNYALTRAENEVIVNLDADTVLGENALHEVLLPFTKDDDIVGVAGNVQINNDTDSWWTRIQSFEYAVSMEVVRMFESRLHHMLCISGCFGAFDREAIEAVGGWSENNDYADDMDLSIALQQHGDLWFSPHAIVLTDGPTSFRGWWHQRTWWARLGLRTYLHHNRETFAPSAVRDHIAHYTTGGSDGESGWINPWAKVGLVAKTLLAIGILVQVWGVGYYFVTHPWNAFEAFAIDAFVITFVLTAVAALFLFAITSLFIVHRRPLRHLVYLPVYLFLYRPAHIAVKVVGFTQALGQLALIGVRTAVTSYSSR